MTKQKPFDLKQLAQNLKPIPGLFPTPTPPKPEPIRAPVDIRVFRKGIPKATTKIPTLPGFLANNLRGSAFKRAPTAVIGYDKEVVEFAGDRAKWVDLFETEWRAGPGVSRARPPRLPARVHLGAMTDTYGCLITVKMGPEVATLPGTHVMGPLAITREFLRGKKFFIRNRCEDWICVELC